jgi:hypothetical protein
MAMRLLMHSPVERRQYTPARRRAGGGRGACHIVATIDRRIATVVAFACLIAGLKCSRRRHLCAANQENTMELQAQAQAIHSAAGITREMLGLAVKALATGTASALIAGGLVVLLVINQS